MEYSDFEGRSDLNLTAGEAEDFEETASMRARVLARAQQEADRTGRQVFVKGPRKVILFTASPAAEVAQALAAQVATTQERGRQARELARVSQETEALIDRVGFLGPDHPAAAALAAALEHLEAEEASRASRGQRS